MKGANTIITRKNVDWTFSPQRPSSADAAILQDTQSVQMNRRNAPHMHCACANAHALSRSCALPSENMAFIYDVGNRFCPHCDRWLRSSFVEHRALYYNKDTDLWVINSLVSGYMYFLVQCIVCCE